MPAQYKNRLTLTVPEVADLLGLHITTLYRLINAKTLPGFRLGKTYLIPAEAIEHLIDSAYESEETV